MEMTQGPWWVGGGGFVACNTPSGGVNGSDDVLHYGGHLIAESVAPQNLRPIAALPDFVSAAKALVQNHDEVNGSECRCAGCAQFRFALRKAGIQ